VLFDFGQDLVLIDLPIVHTVGVCRLVLPIEDQDGHGRLELGQRFEEAVLEKA
jgi:hypothetical protein